jgi:uncharacterized glyoxalase superfamily protein PhnB
MKSSKIVLIVDSVDKAVKFYTEKLAFDITDLKMTKEGGEQALSYAHLRKGKCFIILRAPHIEELAEFSFIKRCASRCVGIYVEMKKGLDKYYERCQRKGVQISSELKNQDYGYRTFSLKDPYGVKITFAQPIEGFVLKPTDFVGMTVDKTQKDSDLQEEMIRYLKGFSILRRASKKYAKSWLKRFRK